jgi:hypothetical protein
MKTNLKKLAIDVAKVAGPVLLTALVTKQSIKKIAIAAAKDELAKRIGR